MRKPRDVDAYIAAAPKEAQSKLNELRAVIKKTAPAAEERISYGMPCYSYYGGLAAFSIWKQHIGLYMTPSILAQHKSELAAHKTNKATIRLPLDRKLPVALIRRLIKARMKSNALRQKKRIGKQQHIDSAD